MRTKIFKIFVALSVSIFLLDLFYLDAESAPANRNSVRGRTQTSRQVQEVPATPPTPPLTFDMILSNAKDRLKFGYLNGTEFIYEDRPGHLTGYGYEYMEFLANYVHTDFEYIGFDSWDDMYNALQEGTIDIIPGMPGDHKKMPNTTKTQHVVGRFPMKLTVSPSGLKQDMTIGNWAKNYSIDYLPALALSENFTYSLQTFEDYKEMTSAYERGEIDGYVDPLINPQNAKNIAAIFDRHSYYLSVRSDRTDLLERLNITMDQLLLYQPNIRERLNKKYFRSDGFPLILSRPEKEYLAEKKKFRTAFVSYQKPYAYYDENNKLVGLTPEILQQMEKDLNVEIEIIETKSIDATRELIKNGQIDFIADSVCDQSWLKNINGTPTQSYLNLDYVAVTRPDFYENPSELPIVACCAEFLYTKTFIEPKYPVEKRLYVSNLAEAIRAVNNGQADIAYVQRNFVQDLIDETGAYNLEVGMQTVYTEPISVCVYSEADPKLWHIFNKEINHLNNEWIQNTLSKHQQATFHLSPRWIIYHHPGKSISFILFVVILVGGTYAYRNRMREKHLELVQHMAYTDLRYDLPNVSWLEREVPKIMDDYKKDDDVKIYFVVFALASNAVITEDFGRMIIKRKFKRMAEKISKEPNVLATAAGIDVEHLICLCKAPNDEKIISWAEDIVRNNKYMRTADTKSQIVLKIRVGITRYTYTMYVQPSVDRALTACHQKNNDGVMMFDEKLEKNITMRHTIEATMEQALKDGEFTTYFQPKYDIRTRRIVGAEALVRWISPQKGFMPPGQFIPLFEHNGFVIPVDYLMLENTFKFQKERIDAGKEVVTISVNQSRLHMTEAGYLDKMRAIVEKYQLPPGLIELEITETVFGDFDSKASQENAAEIVRGLHEMGFTISVDDFGSGYSSFMLLSYLPMDVMKIDRSILVAADTSQRAREILANVIRLGKSLDMKVICEGIETVEQEKLLLEYGCNYGQGFLNSKPLPMDEFVEFFEKRNAEIRKYN